MATDNFNLNIRKFHSGISRVKKASTNISNLAAKISATNISASDLSTKDNVPAAANVVKGASSKFSKLLTRLQNTRTQLEQASEETKSMFDYLDNEEKMTEEEAMEDRMARIDNITEEEVMEERIEQIKKIVADSGYTGAYTVIRSRDDNGYIVSTKDFCIGIPDSYWDEDTTINTEFYFTGSHATNNKTCFNGTDISSIVTGDDVYNEYYVNRPADQVKGLNSFEDVATEAMTKAPDTIIFVTNMNTASQKIKYKSSVVDAGANIIAGLGVKTDQPGCGHTIVTGFSEGGLAAAKAVIQLVENYGDTFGTPELVLQDAHHFDAAHFSDAEMEKLCDYDITITWFSIHSTDRFKGCNGDIFKVFEKYQNNPQFAKYYDKLVDNIREIAIKIDAKDMHTGHEQLFFHYDVTSALNEMYNGGDPTLEANDYRPGTTYTFRTFMLDENGKVVVNKDSEFEIPIV